MPDTSKLTSGLSVISGWVIRFSIINILWLLSNLPIIFIIFIYIFSDPGVSIFLFLVPLYILIPTIFFPSTAALFASVRDWIMKREDYSLIKSYFKYYKASYKKSFLAGIILATLWFILAFDYYYFSFSIKNNSFSLFFLILMLAFFVYTINFFSFSAHYHMDIPKLLKSTLLFTVGNPLLFFTILLTNYFIWYLSLMEIWFLIPLFTGSLIAFVSFSGFYRAITRAQAKQDKL